MALSRYQHDTRAPTRRQVGSFGPVLPSCQTPRGVVSDLHGRCPPASRRAPPPLWADEDAPPPTVSGAVLPNDLMQHRYATKYDESGLLGGEHAARTVAPPRICTRRGVANTPRLAFRLVTSRSHASTRIPHAPYRHSAPPLILARPNTRDHPSAAMPCHRSQV